MIKICLINVWIGTLPDWFPLWRLSAEKNPTIDFYIVTNNKGLIDSANVHFVNMELAEIKRRIEEKTGFKIKLNSPYKLCDYKMLYSAIFQEIVGTYDYWGHIDLDVIFGNIRKALDRIGIEKYDRVFEAGNFSLYRNTPEINELYKRSDSADVAVYSYRKAFRNNYACYFDEYMGMNILSWKYLGERAFRDQNIENYIQDFSWQKLNFESYITHESFVFCWQDGTLLRYVTNESGLICEDPEPKEYLLVHIQKRKMQNLLDGQDLNEIKRFWIVPNAFCQERPQGKLYDEVMLEQYRLSIVKQDKARRCKNLKNNGIIDYIPHYLTSRRVLRFLRKEKGFF